MGDTISAMNKRKPWMSRARRHMNRKERLILYVLLPFHVLVLVVFLIVANVAVSTTFWADSFIVRAAWFYVAPLSLALGAWIGRTINVGNRERWGLAPDQTATFLFSGFSYACIGLLIHAIPALLYMTTVSEPETAVVSVIGQQYSRPRSLGLANNRFGPKKIPRDIARLVDVRFDGFNRTIYVEMDVKVGEKLELRGRKGSGGFVVDDYRRLN